MQNATLFTTDASPLLVENILISICLGLIFITNICVNSGILVCLWRNEQLHVATNAIVAATCGNDLLIAITCVLAQLVSSCIGSWFFDDRFSFVTAFFSAFCRTFGSLCVTFLVITRYLSLRYFSWTGPSKINVYRFLLLSVVISIIFAVPWFVIFGEEAISYGEHAEMTQEYVIERCIYSSHRGNWIVFQTAVGRLVPFTLSLYSCIKISVVSAKSKMKMASSFGTNYQIRIFAETKHAMTVLSIGLTHLICQLPLCINEMLMWTLKKENGVLLAHPSLALLSWLNSAINPVIYLLKNPNLPQQIQYGNLCPCILSRNRTYTDLASRRITSENHHAENVRMDLDCNVLFQVSSSKILHKSY